MRALIYNFLLGVNIFGSLHTKLNTSTIRFYHGYFMLLSRFKTEEEAVTIANNTRMGLAGYFFSNDMSQIWRVAEEMEVGMVGINDPSSPFGIDIPFGGVKESGLGVEGSRYGLQEFQNTKVMGFGI